MSKAPTPTGKPDVEADDPKMQGEGNITAARRYDESQQRFVASGQVEQAAQAAAPRDEQEAKALERAEEEGKRKAKR